MGEITWWTEKLLYILLRFPSTIFPLFRPAIIHLWIFKCEDSVFAVKLHEFHITFSLLFLREKVFHSHFLHRNLQPFMLPCPVMEVTFGCQIKNIFPWHPYNSPEILLAFHADFDGDNRRWEYCVSPLWEWGNTPILTPQNSALIWLECKLSMW